MKDYEEAARQIVETVPFILRKVHSDMRACGSGAVPSHFRLLSILLERPYTLSELAEMQGVSLATVSRTISTLVDRGWVRRLSSTGDRRVVQVEITPKGMETVRQIQAGLIDGLEDMLAGLDPQEIITLREGMTVLKKVFLESDEENKTSAQMEQSVI